MKIPRNPSRHRQRVGGAAEPVGLGPEPKAEVARRHLVMAGEAKDAVSVCTQRRMSEAPRLLRLLAKDFAQVCVRLPPRRSPKTWDAIDKPVVLHERNIHGAGLLCNGKLKTSTFEKRLGNWYQLGTVVTSNTQSNHRCRYMYKTPIRLGGNEIWDLCGQLCENASIWTHSHWRTFHTRPRERNVSDMKTIGHLASMVKDQSQDQRKKREDYPQAVTRIMRLQAEQPSNPYIPRSR